MKYSNDGFHRTVSLDTARRRSVGDSASHVEAGYARTLVGDAARNRRRSPWERHPFIDELTGWGIVLGLCAAVWIVAVALVAGVVEMFMAVFL